MSMESFTRQVGFGEGAGDDSTSQADDLDAARTRRAQEMVLARQRGRTATIVLREPGAPRK
jgi:hypothetical protein